jgi:hypothetical protein
MKKLVFGLIATVMLSGFSFGQKLTAEQSKSVNEQMVKLVDNAKDYLSKNNGASYNQFILDVTSNRKVATMEGQQLLSKVYDFASKGTSTDEIMKSYDGKELLSVVALIKAKGLIGDEATVAVFGGTGKICGFWCGVWHSIVNAVVEWAIELLHNWHP